MINEIVQTERIRMKDFNILFFIIIHLPRNSRIRIIAGVVWRVYSLHHNETVVRSRSGVGQFIVE